jgi:hypothetical protein
MHFHLSKTNILTNTKKNSITKNLDKKNLKKNRPVLFTVFS